MLRLKKIVILLLVSCSVIAQNPITWDYSRGVSFSGSSLTKNVNQGNYGSSGAVSGNLLLANQNGWAEFKVAALNQRLAFGFINNTNVFSNSDEDEFNEDLYELDSYKFAIELSNSNKLKIYKNGEQQGQYGNYAVNDIIRIEKNGNTISFKKNNIILTQFTVSQINDLKLISSIKTHSASILNPVANFIKPLTISVAKTDAYCNNLQKGNINLSVSGGTSPYTYLWNTNATTNNINNLKPSTYNYTITDNVANTKNGSVQLLSCVRWIMPTGVTVNNNTLTKTASNLWGNAGASSINQLKRNDNGFVTYKYDGTKNFAFGLDAVSNQNTINYTTILFNYLVIDKHLIVTNNGVVKADLGKLKIGDVLTINKIGNSIQYFKNNLVLFEQEIATTFTQDFQVEAALYKNGQTLTGVKTSFFRNNLSVDFLKGDVLSTDEPNSAYIQLLPKNGLAPYRYLWNTGSIENALSDIGIGTYSVLVTDSLQDTVKLSFNIGQKVTLTNANNVYINNNRYVKSEIDKPASLNFNTYIPSSQNGYYEINLLNTQTNFNLALRAFNPDADYNQAPLAIRQTTVNIPLNQLPAQGTPAYNNINFADDIVYADYRKVIQREFINANCTINCDRVLVSGVQVDYGKLYIISNGVSIQKGSLLENNSTLRLAVEGNLMLVSVNNQPRGSRSIAPTTLIGELTLLAPEVSLGGNISSGGIITPNFNAVGCRNCGADNFRNWMQQTAYNELGATIATSRSYFDNMGRATQNQVKNIAENTILATQTIYDAYGREVLGTLPAPINQSCFCYKTNFITNGANANYTFNDFDIPNYTSNATILSTNEADKPAAVNNANIGTLGWYYSNNNGFESYVPAAATPYSRVHYSTVDPSSVLKNSQPGSQLNSGSGHETYNFKMATMGELNHIFGPGLGWRVDAINNFYSTDPCTDFMIKPLPLLNTSPVSVKSIGVDENGNETVSFVDLTGNVIANCLAGQVNGVNVKTQTIKGWLSFANETQRYIDVHLPQGCESSLGIENLSGFSATFNVIDLKTGQYVKFGGNTNYSFSGSVWNPNLPAGYYRIVAVAFANNSLFTGVNVVHQLNYYNFTLNYYDYANRLKAIVPPKGFDDAYVYNGSAFYQNGSSPLYLITNATTGTEPANFPPNQSWSTNSANFNNEYPITLSPVLPNATHNVNLKFTIGGQNGPTIGFDPNPSNGPTGDQRVFQNSTAFGDYFSQTTNVDTTTQINPFNFKPLCPSLNIVFKVRVCLVDAAGNTIPNTTQENNNLTCHVEYCQGEPERRSWIPTEFYFNDVITNASNSGNVNSSWAKIKILKLEPIPPTFGNNFTFYTYLVGTLKSSINIVELKIPQVPNHKMVDRYRYNSWGQLLNSVGVDAGQTDYVYSIDGKTKYTQNAKQDASSTNQLNRTFSYVDYDGFDRPISGGEQKPSSITPINYFFNSYQEFETNPSPAPPNISIHNATEINLGAIFSTYATNRDAVSVMYDQPDPNFYSETGLNSANYIQRHMAGMVSTSYNEFKRTWYSYDEQGRVEWVVQKYYGVNQKFAPNNDMVKTYNYTYDYLGNLLKLDYNKEDPTDAFYHYYEYDANQRLKRAYTSRDNVTKTLQANYSFYLHGPLKRIELANKLQGLDFVYTINGWLKAVNGPEMDKQHDAGKDGYLNSSTTTYKDIFGMNLDYFHNDYERAGTNVESYDESQNTSSTPFAPDLFNGIVKAQRWQTRTPVTYIGLSYPNQHVMYGFQYDKKYQLTEANFANITGISNQNLPLGEFIVNNIAMAVNVLPDYRVHNLNYDYNGNLLSLTRKAYAASPAGINMDNLTYNYPSCSNKLSQVTDAVAANPYNSLDFKAGQTTNNYQYNTMGELQQDNSNNKKYIYNSYGNITSITDNADNEVASYAYDEMGYRIRKTVTLASNVKKHTWYVRDAGGQIVTTFEKTGVYNLTDFTTPSEWNVYAGSRVGILDNTGANETYVYELADHLGNVRATFKQQNKTQIITGFEDTEADNNWFTIYPTGMDNTLPPALNKGQSVKTQYPVLQYGGGTKGIPVKNGNNLTIEYSSLFTGPVAPNAGMVIQITDAAGNVLGNNWQIVSVNGTQNAWNDMSIPYTVTANYPDMYLSIFPWNLDNTGAPVWFDDYSIIFATGSVPAPEQLNMATYYPHGSVMPGMNYNTSYNYKYGYQGQFAEKDVESNENFFELRNYNPLLGRFATIDPYEQYFSSYMAMGNSHPNTVDPDGGVVFDVRSALIGAAVGAGVGAIVAGAIDIADGKGTSKAKQRDTWALSVGSGIVAGAAIFGFGSETTVRQYRKSGVIGYWKVDFGKLNNLFGGSLAEGLKITITRGALIIPKPYWHTLKVFTQRGGFKDGYDWDSPEFQKYYDNGKYRFIGFNFGNRQSSTFYIKNIQLLDGPPYSFGLFHESGVRKLPYFFLFQIKIKPDKPNFRKNIIRVRFDK